MRDGVYKIRRTEANDVRIGLNGIYSPAEELNISNEACNSVDRKCFSIF